MWPVIIFSSYKECFQALAIWTDQKTQEWTAVQLNPSSYFFVHYVLPLFLIAVNCVFWPWWKSNPNESSRGRTDLTWLENYYKFMFINSNKLFRILYLIYNYKYNQLQYFWIGLAILLRSIQPPFGMIKFVVLKFL